MRDILANSQLDSLALEYNQKTEEYEPPELIPEFDPYLEIGSILFSYHHLPPQTFDL